MASREEVARTVTEFMEKFFRLALFSEPDAKVFYILHRAASYKRAVAIPQLQTLVYMSNYMVDVEQSLKTLKEEELIYSQSEDLEKPVYTLTPAGEATARFAYGVVFPRLCESHTKSSGLGPHLNRRAKEFQRIDGYVDRWHKRWPTRKSDE